MVSGFRKGVHDTLIEEGCVNFHVNVGITKFDRHDIVAAHNKEGCCACPLRTQSTHFEENVNNIEDGLIC
jgi:hypothetical protein